MSTRDWPLSMIIEGYKLMNTMKRSLLGISMVALLGLGMSVNAEEMMGGMKSSKEMMGKEAMEEGAMPGKEMGAQKEKAMMMKEGAMHEADMDDQKKMDMDKGMEKEADMKKEMMEKKMKRPM